MKTFLASDTHARHPVDWLLRFLGGLIFGLFLSAPAHAEDYLVGPQDKLKIDVVEWRPTTASIFEWSPLTGIFTISTGGNLSLPILGTLPVAGKTVEEIAEDVSEKLQKIVGLQQRPSASVEVAEYRPFFVGGLVARPGKYDYFPGLTILQALSIAGGYARPTDGDMMGLQRDVLSSRGSLRELQAERLSLLARNARLEAVIGGASEITFPAEIVSQADRPGMRQILEDERKIFEATRRAIDEETRALQRNKNYASEQTEVLKSKESALDEQAALADEELGKITGLVTKGLSVSTRQFGAEQYVSELQNRQLDVAMALISTQQSVAQAEFRIADVEAKYRLDAQSQQIQVRDRLTSINEKIETVRAQIDTIELYAPQAAAVADIGAEEPLVTTIIRNLDGKLQRIPVEELSEVLPGDVVQVEQSAE